MAINNIESCVFVVLNGKVVLRKHSLDDPGHFDIVKVATSGSILGV